MVDHPWVQEGERTTCTKCQATFCIADGDQPCLCLSPASADAPQAHTSDEPAPAGESAGAATSELGSTAFWRRRLRESDGAFVRLRKRARKIRTSVTTDLLVKGEPVLVDGKPLQVTEPCRWFANEKDLLRLELEILDRERKNAWTGYQASLTEKSDADLAEKRRLVEVAQEIERRRRAH